ncbi:hypothetical protein Fmac_017445 [Flemingia macrophylla]|uniref:Uncharacterized protein n=1 Tax=Flemingia macrophylla TaxID=520843 RepID=A0ABD1M242_9FABA
MLLPLLPFISTSILLRPPLAKVTSGANLLLLPPPSSLKSFFLLSQAKPFIQFYPGDGVTLVLAQCDDVSAFNHVLDNSVSPRDVTESRALLPDLEFSDSLISVISFQITLFPNKGFCIVISFHHAVRDGTSFQPCMFVKAMHVNMVKKNHHRYCQNLSLETSKERSLKIMSSPIEEGKVRATFNLTRGDLEKLIYEKGVCALPKPFTRPKMLNISLLGSPFIVRHCWSLESLRITLGIVCLFTWWMHTMMILLKKMGVGVIVAKRIWSKIKMLDKGAVEGVEETLSRYFAMLSEGVTVIGVVGSTDLGIIYEIDFGWGRPERPKQYL